MSTYTSGYKLSSTFMFHYRGFTKHTSKSLFSCFHCWSHLLQLSQEAVQSLIGQLTHLKHGHCMTLQVLVEGQRHRGIKMGNGCPVFMWLTELSLCVHIQSLTGDRLPIMRKAVRVESKRKAILFVGTTGILRLLTLAVSATETQKKKDI